MTKKTRHRKYGKNNNVSINDGHENPGLDADGSSDDFSIYGNLNNDNDRISGNPDGEDDQKNSNEPPGHSLLEDK